MKKTMADLQAEAEAFRAAAQREHENARHWMNRAITAEKRLALYDAREKGTNQ